MLAVGAGGVVTTFCLSFIISLFFSPSLWKSVSYILKFCLKGPLDPKQPIVKKFSFHTSQACFYCSGPTKAPPLSWVKLTSVAASSAFNSSINS